MEEVNFRLKVEADKAVSSVEKVNKEVSNTSKETKKANKSLDGLKDALDKATGGAISGFQGMLKGIKGATGGFKGLKGAIVATGIGALVVVVASLVEFFNNFEAGVRITTKAMNVLGGTVNAIVDNFSKLLQGDIIGFFKGVGDGAAQAAKDTDDLFDAEKRLFELQRDSIVQNAELNAELRLKERAVRDSTLSTEERIKAQERINEISEKLIENEKAEIEEKLKKLKLEKSLDNNYKKEQDLTLAIEQAKASLIRTQGRLNESEDKGAKQVRRIREQEEKDEAAKEKKAEERAEKKAVDEQKAREKRKQLQEEQEKELEQLRLKRITDEAERLERETEIEIEALREKYGKGTELEAELIRNRDQRLAEIEQEELEANEQAKLEIFKRFEEQRLAAITEKAEQRKQAEETELQFQKDVESAKEDVVMQGLGLLRQVAGDNEKIQAGLIITEKIAAIAKIISNTAVANAKAVAATPLTGGQPFVTLNQISAGIGIASTVAAAAKGISQLGEGGGAGDGGAQAQLGRGAQGQAAQQAQAPDFNIVGDAGNNEIAGAIGNRNGRPQKSYVVSKEMTTQAELDRNIEEEASLG